MARTAIIPSYLGSCENSYELFVSYHTLGRVLLESKRRLWLLSAATCMYHKLSGYRITIAVVLFIVVVKNRAEESRGSTAVLRSV